MLKRNKMDTIEGLQSSIDYMRIGFSTLEGQLGSQVHVEGFRQKMESILQTIDGKMTALIQKEGEDGDLTNWAARMGSCTRMFDVLDRNIPFKGKRQWNWDEVIGAMAFLKAVEEGAKLTLGEYGID